MSSEIKMLELILCVIATVLALTNFFVCLLVGVCRKMELSWGHFIQVGVVAKTGHRLHEFVGFYFCFSFLLFFDGFFVLRFFSVFVAFLCFLLIFLGQSLCSISVPQVWHFLGYFFSQSLKKCFIDKLVFWRKSDSLGITFEMRIEMPEYCLLFSNVDWLDIRDLIITYWKEAKVS